MGKPERARPPPKRRRTETETVDISNDEPDSATPSSPEALKPDSGKNDIEIIDVLDDGPVPLVQESTFSEAKCPICLDQPERLCVTECGHLYCSDCVYLALSSSARSNKTYGECSVCRHRVRYGSVLFLEMRLRPEPKHDSPGTEVQALAE